MKTRIARATFFLLICLALPLTTSAQGVDFPDSNLRAAIEKALNKPSGAAITVAEIATLNRLDARNANISDLTGVGLCGQPDKPEPCEQHGLGHSAVG